MLAVKERNAQNGQAPNTVNTAAAAAAVNVQEIRQHQQQQQVVATNNEVSACVREREELRSFDWNTMLLSMLLLRGLSLSMQSYI